MIITNITDKVTVARWILNTQEPDEYKEYYLGLWFRGKTQCWQFKEDMVPVGWVLCHALGESKTWIDFISVSGNKVKQVFEEAMRQFGVRELRMTTDRPKAWERLMGFETVKTIMKKEI